MATAPARVERKINLHKYSSVQKVEQRRKVQLSKIAVKGKALAAVNFGNYDSEHTLPMKETKWAKQTTITAEKSNAAAVLQHILKSRAMTLPS